jgi:hypothetical protein
MHSTLCVNDPSQVSWPALRSAVTTSRGQCAFVGDKMRRFNVGCRPNPTFALHAITLSVVCLGCSCALSCGQGLSAGVPFRPLTHSHSRTAPAESLCTSSTRGLARGCSMWPEAPATLHSGCSITTVRRPATTREGQQVSGCSLLHAFVAMRRRSEPTSMDAADSLCGCVCG